MEKEKQIYYSYLTEKMFKVVKDLILPKLNFDLQLIISMEENEDLGFIYRRSIVIIYLNEIYKESNYKDEEMTFLILHVVCHELFHFLQSMEYLEYRDEERTTLSEEQANYLAYNFIINNQKYLEYILDITIHTELFTLSERNNTLEYYKMYNDRIDYNETCKCLLLHLTGNNPKINRIKYINDKLNYQNIYLYISNSYEYYNILLAEDYHYLINTIESLQREITKYRFIIDNLSSKENKILIADDGISLIIYLNFDDIKINGIERI